MNLKELLKNLSALQIELWVEGDKLRYRAAENALTPELLAAIKNNKTEIIHLLSQQSEEIETYPLSHGQKALWFLYQLAPESAAYNLTYSAKLADNVDVNALQKAAQALIERHPALRTKFTTIDGEPVQKVNQNQQVEFKVENAFALSQTEIKNWLLEKSALPFDLETGAVVRFNLLINNKAKKEYILLITQHHITGDFWSLGIILEDLKVLYEAIVKDREPLLSEQKSTYRDYIKWSEEMLTGASGEELWEFWQKQLSGELPLINLPTDKPRPQNQTYNGNSLVFRLEDALLKDLQELAKKEKVSLYMLLLTVWQILLLKYTNQEDILIGSPTINRSRPEFEKILGYFTNPVVLRGNLSGNPTVSELLSRTRISVLEALENQEYPFPLLVEKLQPVRNTSISPIYQVAFAWDRVNNSEQETTLVDNDRLIKESIITGTKGAAFDLTLSITNEPYLLRGTWNYNTDLFDSSTIERMTGHFTTLLSAIVENPQTKINQLPILTAVEEKQLLFDCNQTEQEYPKDKCIHQLFESQVEKTPDAVAVVFEDKQLTYAELNQKANQLAHYLISLGVKADTLVGICVERSLEMIVGILGILKAGGAYVPLDPEYPQERLNFILEDTKVKVLLTQQSLVNKLPKNTAKLVYLEGDSQSISQCSQNNLKTEVQTTNLAYVIYTSGSTGKPKGVEVIHQGVNRLLFGVNYVQLDEKQRFLQIAPISFDASTFEIWGALLHGGLCVIFPENIPTAERLGHEIDKHEITILWLTASLFNSIIDEDAESLSGVKQLLIGGEALSVTHVKKGLQKLPSTQIINGYGPTESTTFTCCYPINRLEKTTESIPIGKPISNTKVYILDKNLQQVPVGVAGELHIGGAGLARGYLNRPELTAEKFITNPFENGNTKLYKTGDLVKYLVDGNIEYLGRIDNQVKIRGFRIELGEIETALSQNQEIQTSCVIVREDNPGNKQLVAYIVSETTSTVSELRQYLKGRLPEYMIPNAFVYLENLPLTPNGKIDRRALPAPDQSELQLEYIAPRTATEEILTLIWAEVLKIERVGITDNFFELGGHSLLATQIVSRIRSNFNIEIPLQSIFTAATLEEQAKLIQQTQTQKAEINQTPIKPRIEKTEIPLSFSQQRLWFLDKLEPNSSTYNIPAALKLEGKIDKLALEKSLKAIINRHESLRTNFREIAGKAEQIIHTDSDWKLSIIDLQNLSTEKAEKEIERLTKQQATQPFNLSNENLIRITLILLSDTENILSLCMHHIISDGWSMGVFIDELSALYNSYIQGKETELKPLPIQYADFAIWQRNWLQGEVLEQQINYWSKQLENAPTFLPLPTDRPRPAVQTFAGAYQEFTISKELTEKLQKVSKEQGVTLFMTLLAAYNTLLYRYTGQTDILVGTPIANRNRKEIESLIGFFVNTLVLRTELSGNSKFSEILNKTRSTALSAYAHQDLPFEMLVEALEIERDLSHSPLFQAVFALQNAPISEIELTGLKTNLLPIETATAKFDLTLSIEQTETGLIGGWEYNTDLFDSSTINRMTGHFINLLSAIVENPAAEINQLPILTETEKQQLLIDWNQTETEYPKDKCIHQLFEEQVEKTPDAVAVVFEGKQLTYRELNNKANQLAHYLISLGVKADSLVGICVERSLEMIIGQLGILKAGASYLPIDPEYPTERIKFILEDTKINILLTQQNLKQKIQNNQTQTTCLDTEWEKINQQNQKNPHKEITSNNLAYIIYTSGSTGTPKGVEITHQGLTNLINWHQKQFKITTADKATQLAGTGFDAAVWETWPYLTAGATLHLVRKEILVSPEQLQKWLTENQITISFVPTPITQELLKLDWKKEKTKLRYLLTGGDKLTQNPTNKIPFQVINNYGPTENTVVTTSCILETQKQTSPSIGKPIDNTKVYILDSNLQPVPVGVAGELHIAGTGLARGYLNRPELTAEKFIPNPFDNGKTKLYKTGDLVRYLTDGNIEYLGRSDNQVKIRGFRIEIGEIETALNQNENVQTSVVVVREDKPGYKKLVAYIVSETKLTTKELRKYLKSKLPEYMIPSNFVYLENLPLTPNGKIDRRALPEPKTNTEIEKKYIAPKTEIETKLAEIWQQVLGIEKIGINDNFFELGGDSILSIQIIAKAKQQGIEITLKQLFANQTIAELAAVAGTIKTLEIEQVTVSGNFLLTPIQKWFLEQNRPETHHFNQAFLLTVPAEIDRNKIEKTWQEIINHHDALRLRFTETENQWKATHSEPIETFEIEYFDISEVTETEKTEIIETTADTLQASLDLESNLVKVGLFKLGENQPGRLLIIIHHLVVDGISWRILLEDLETGYQQLNQNQKIQLPAKTTSFKTWSEKLSEYAQTETLKSEIDYWVNKSNSAIKSIPVDKEGENTLSSTQNIAVSLNQKETTALLQEVPKAYKTQINDILLTALVLVLSKWTNSKSVLFNLEGHGREDILDGVEISRTIGWFTTMFPVVINIEKTEFNNLENTIKSVKEQLREIPNKGIGYGVLRYLSEDKSIKKQITKTPKAEISFNYLGQFTQTLNTSSLLSSADESSGQDQSSVGQRSNLLDINAIIAEEHLQINWTYSNNIHEKTTVEKIAQEFITALQEIITHCLEPENVGYTPSDFPLIKLKQPELDGVLGKLGKLNWQNIEDIYPLSPMQEGMLFESLYAPEGGVYFEQITCTFNGELNIKAFEKAWQKLVNRHSIFRTAFIWESLSQAVQVVYKQVDLGVEIRDWRELSEQQTEIETFLEEERKQGFKLDKIPLMRLYLLQLSDESYQFVWCHHHILLDGWSLPLVFKDLFEFYQEIIDGVETVNKPSLNYRNYIEWLQQQKQDAAQEFWQEKLSGFDAPTPLVVEKSLSSQKTQSEYKEEVVYLSVEKTNKATEFVRKHQLTMSNLVQGVWGLLLSRYSQENDVVFGSTVSGRPPSLPGVESMVGLFINTLPVRVQVSDDNNVLSLLKELQQQQVESEQFSYCSLVEIQGWSDVTRGTSLFDSLVVFENYPVDADTLDDDGGLQVENFRGIEHTNYPLTVISGPGEQLWVKVSYDNSRFDEGTINRMLGHFLTLLSAIVENSQGEINQLPILTATEEKQLLIDWNQTETEYPKDKCIHQLFEEQVEKTPDAVAVVFENQQLTYSELNNKANQLAHYLISLGVKADVLVGICVERSVEMIVGILGILKAGGAYVPLDPEYPQERISYMIENSGVEILLTQQHLLTRLPQEKTIICVDADREKINQYSQENPITETTVNNLIYTIYTSGSTGKPKGAAVYHRGFVNLVQWMINDYQFTEKDSTALISSLSFDLTQKNIFTPLLIGGKLNLSPNGFEPSKILEIISKQQATWVNCTPSTFSAILASGEDSFSKTKSLKYVFLGGEPISIPSLLNWLDSEHCQAKIVNSYGPTECTDVCAAYTVETPHDFINKSIPIGKPIPNVQLYILNQELQPLPVGVIGELFIGGIGLGKGYIGDEERTNEKFILNPLDNGQTKLYRTGDLVRYLKDGNIEYIERIDNQVKIRGFRIELGEIEALLNTHPQVQQAVVIAREDIPGDKRLVAYIVPQSEQEPNVSQLREFLKTQLPNYMIPAAVVILASLPLTANGKVNRRALPAPETSAGIEESFVAPRTPIEAKLAEIWSQVLKVELIGVNDNFFDLGGHSLLATQVISRSQAAFGIPLRLRSLFTSPTIAQLSQVILEQLQTNSGFTLPAITPVPSRENIPLSWAQERLWFVHQLEGDSGAYTMSFSVGLTGDVNVKALEQAFQAIVQRHEVLRTRFEVEDNSPVQVIVPDMSITLPVVDIQQIADPWQKVKELAIAEVAQPFNLAHDAVIRVKLWQLSPQEYLLLVAIHHIAADGWSLGIFIQDLSAYYRAIATNSPVELPDLTVQYADFTVWQRQWLTDQTLDRQLNYWMQQLTDAPPILALPTDRSRPAIQTFNGSTQPIQLDPDLTQKLKKLSQKFGTTLYMTLMAGFVILMSRYSGQKDLVIGSPIANRNRTEIESLIGFFVNTLALRFNLTPEESFAALLTQVQQITQNAYDHQDLPFEILVDHLQLERNLDRNPLVQVMFALQNAPSSPWDMPGVNIEEIPLGLDTVRFDLEVHLWDMPEGVGGVFCYNTDLFDQTTIVRMMQHFQALLTAIVENPQQPVASLPLLTQSEQQQLLVEWNHTETDYPQDQCIHQLFAQQVEKTPDTIALEYGNQQLTYCELNNRANQLAHYLISLGIGADTLVGISVERSAEMVIGLLGILKAGGAYVPLDPDYPTERLVSILEDAQVRVLLTTEKLAQTIPANQARIISYDRDVEAIAQQSQENPVIQTTSENLAYVIYTSGSTGKPKGVSVTHQGVNRLVLNTNYINIKPQDVIAQASNYAFDAATFEIWGALLTGAKLVGVSKQIALSPRELAATIRSQGISVLFLTTALFNQIAQTEPTAFSTLRYLLFGGEAVDPKWVQEILKKGSPEQLLHVYGPTENTTFTSWYLVENVPNHATTIPIGKPIANTQIYLLDENLQPVPVGVPGELHIGGAGLARGYLNRPELTAEKFISNPLDNGKTKLYKTGDLASYLPDGNIEYVSRIDNQVKIRGFRIELGEIEAVLNQYPLVQESVVIIRTSSAGDKSLVAYLVPGTKSQELPEQFAEWQSEFISDWQILYEQAYGQGEKTTEDLTFNTAGWNSSYNREPIPEVEMREWVENTVNRIRKVSPQRVIEIGCGTGLLLSRLAPSSPQYWGTDYSVTAIEYVQQLRDTVPGLEHVQLRHQMADNFTGIPQNFDTVILNSIIQYFPSVEYLLQVITGAMESINNQGYIFIGDVRSFPLLEPYYAAVQLSQASESRTVEQWQQVVHQSVAAEEELLVDPRFFLALKQTFPQITWVEIQPKRGNAINELTQFRYDVTMHLGSAVPTKAVSWLNWQLDQLSLAKIQHQLTAEQPAQLGIRAIPNRRLQKALLAWQWLESPPGVETVGELRELLAKQPETGVNPEQFWQLGQNLGYTVEVSWWAGTNDGAYDVVFSRHSSTIKPEFNIFWEGENVTVKPWTHYTNNPLSGKLVQKLVPQVREFIQQKLPNYMIPQAFVLLNSLPLTPNGKVDRRALPTPDTASRSLSGGCVSPRTPVEAQLVQIWSEVLGMETIGVKDNFFEIGGHSLLATQVISRINSAFSLNLSVQKMFEFPTVAEIADYMEMMNWATTDLSADQTNTEIVEF
ncbi:non-ribosomal peptide synthase/polyketide synthase [Okeanomitos corallinicola TIOX110]|uniref:Non-ribosomal peptide synthase/polyketide synthase n=1 Tax=Okeanomitos corallinicola TIOX110 TaxID=3133117 RepID=A0ABZ2USZ5_9CYAN